MVMKFLGVKIPSDLYHKVIKTEANKSAETRDCLSAVFVFKKMFDTLDIKTQEKAYKSLKPEEQVILNVFFQNHSED